MKKEKIIFTIIVAIVAFYIFNRGAYVYSSLNGDIFTRLNMTLELIFTSISENIFYIDTSKFSLVIGFIGFISVVLVYLYHMFKRNNRLEGIEHGSAEWGTIKDVKPFVDKVFEQNMILTETESMTINTRQTLRNNNILVVGG